MFIVDMLIERDVSPNLYFGHTFHFIPNCKYFNMVVYVL